MAGAERPRRGCVRQAWRATNCGATRLRAASGCAPSSRRAARRLTCSRSATARTGSSSSARSCAPRTRTRGCSASSRCGSRRWVALALVPFAVQYLALVDCWRTRLTDRSASVGPRVRRVAAQDPPGAGDAGTVDDSGRKRPRQQRRRPWSRLDRLRRRGEPAERLCAGVVVRQGH